MNRALLEDITAHILAGFITLGFFATVLIALLVFIDLDNPTNSSLVGIVMGYVAGSINPVLSRYFKTEMPAEFRRGTQDRQTTPAPPQQGGRGHPQ